MTQFVPGTYPDFDTDSDGRAVAFRDRGGQHHGLVTYQTSPGGGVEKFTVSGLRRADGTVAPLIDTGDGWELLNGWHPRQLFEDGTPGEIFDNRLSLMYSSLVPAAIAQDGEKVALRAGVLNPGALLPATNAVQYSENFGGWNLVTSALAQTDGDWTLTPNAGTIGSVRVAITRTAGDISVYAVEAKIEASRWLYLGPGGLGSWFNLQNGLPHNAPGSAAFAASTVMSAREGYVWCIVSRVTGEMSSSNTDLRIYCVGTQPTGNTPDTGSNNGSTSVTLRRAYYGRNKVGFSESDYNKTTATLPGWKSSGNYCVQEVEADRPTLDNGALTMEGGDSMTVVFASAPGVGSTVARAVPGVGAQITTGESVGAEHTISTSDTALVVIGRALTMPETRNMHDWLNLRAGGQ